MAAANTKHINIQKNKNAYSRFTFDIFVCPVQYIAWDRILNNLRRVSFFLCVCARTSFGSNISKTVEDSGSVPVRHQYEIVYGESNAHVIYDVT